MDRMSGSSGTVRNPLDLFPPKLRIPKNKSIESHFLPELPAYERKRESAYNWLHSDKIDPTFGIKGNNQDIHIRRSYRRIASSTIFQKVNKNDVVLSDIYNNSTIITKIDNRNGSNSSSNNFVVVEESRMKELTAIEEILRDEKEKLKEQCAMTITNNNGHRGIGLTSIISDKSKSYNNNNLELNVPCLATKLALHKLIEDDLHNVVNECIRLNSKWKEYYKLNHYDFYQSHGARHESISHLPLMDKMRELQIHRELDDSKKVRKERDTMSYEDDLSYLYGKFNHLMKKKDDYDMYYILAAKFGIYDENEYYSDKFPGSRYYTQVLYGATQFQSLWGKYWAKQKILRHNSASMIQRQWRYQWAYKKYHPLIKLRMRFGSRTYYIYFFPKWKEYIQLLRYCRDIVRYCILPNPFIKLCFTSWKEYYITVHTRKEESKKRLMFKLMNASLFRTFAAWKNDVQGTKALLLSLRRKFQNPHFEQWVKYTDWCKLMKKLNKASCVIQAMVRMRICRLIYMKFINAKRIYTCVMICNARRRLLIETHFTAWEVEDMKRRHAQFIDDDAKSRLKLKILLKQKESDRMKELTDHLSSKNGKYQLKVLARDIKQQMSTSLFNRRRKIHIPFGNDVHNVAVDTIRSQCVAITNRIDTYNYYVKNSVSYIRCPDPHCKAIFCHEQQFHSHISGTIAFHHCNEVSTQGNFSQLYLHMKDAKMVNLMTSYLLSLDTASNGTGTGTGTGTGSSSSSSSSSSRGSSYLSMYLDIQTWKKYDTGSVEYFQLAESMYNTYLKDTADSSTKVKLQLVDNIAIVKKLEFVFTVRMHAHGNYRQLKKSRSILQKLLRSQPGTYIEWTDAVTLSPVMLESIEWECLLKVMTYFTSTSPFYSLPTVVTEIDRIEAMKKQILIDQFKEHRMSSIRTWAYHYKQKEKQLLSVVNSTIDGIIVNVYETVLMGDIVKRGVDEVVFRKTYHSQRMHEERKAVISDAIFTTACVTGNDLFDTCYSTLINTYLNIPSERKLLEEKCGLRQKVVQKKLFVDLNAANKGVEMFNDLFK